MTRLPPPQTSAVPSPSSIFMSPTSSTPEAEEQKQHEQEDSGRRGDDDDDTFPLPKLRLHIQDATHPGASRFLAAVDASALLSRSVQTVLRLLYVSPRHHKAHDDGDGEADPQRQHPATTGRRPARPHYTPPPTRSVTLILEDMPGVAYTKGSDLDGDHKEIHFSLGYIEGVRRAPAAGPTTGGRGDVAGAYEIEGVLVHELVHCFQYNGRGGCPGGLVEGVADWVRLEARLGAPHWRRGAVPDRWDQGYERTAYFLDWLEGKFGRGTVRRMNEALRVREYKQSEFWTGLFGHDVDVLWKEYLRTLKKDGHD
ncbi:putative pbsp domain-containing protein [Diaporthe ampelina]|uniref:Putative pbsp domain-containing protein n=1 Tax=Diaporthe ampelina TaxID=1214573 RepID=A0A0G2F6P4_9PEZI|nr:putative pbsp domain-containing protein [Diaporthe ampelina]